MSLDTKNVSAYKPLFDVLQFDPNAERSPHIQAGGFVWTDETPDFGADGEFPVAITTFMIYLISYRATLMAGKPHEAFTPIWNEFKSLCPSWPGFRPERNDPALLPNLESELDAEYAYLERAIKICDRRKQRRDRTDSHTETN
ncbi:MAG: hypothetical protein GY743_02605 [Planctomycetaceae bacterium]|nr:hypothetical protein [Planctomycetaceae bacterium]